MDTCLNMIRSKTPTRIFPLGHIGFHEYLPYINKFNGTLSNGIKAHCEILGQKVKLWSDIIYCKGGGNSCYGKFHRNLEPCHGVIG